MEAKAFGLFDIDSAVCSKSAGNLAETIHRRTDGQYICLVGKGSHREGVGDVGGLEIE